MDDGQMKHCFNSVTKGRFKGELRVNDFKRFIEDTKAFYEAFYVKNYEKVYILPSEVVLHGPEFKQKRGKNLGQGPFVEGVDRHGERLGCSIECRDRGPHRTHRLACRSHGLTKITFPSAEEITGIVSQNICRMVVRVISSCFCGETPTVHARVALVHQRTPITQ
mmetsp:Transcript_96049/g.311602  ORF Transcript_96049/g.311602 Transcript_96049/m.311602 type:complete len:165 (-) Transcript_96049:118-612(-)